MESQHVNFNNNINEKLRIQYANKRICHKRSPLDCFKQSCLSWFIFYITPAPEMEPEIKTVTKNVLWVAFYC